MRLCWSAVSISGERKDIDGIPLGCFRARRRKMFLGKARMSSYLAGNVTRDSLDFSLNLLRRAPLTVRPTKSQDEINFNYEIKKKAKPIPFACFEVNFIGLRFANGAIAFDKAVFR